MSSKRMLSEIFMNAIPRWGCNSNGIINRWYAEYSYPPLYKDYIANAVGLETVQKTIIQRCQGVLDSSLFDLAWLTIGFKENGIYFEVPGINGCYINPMEYRGYGEHNIDTPEQAFCLFLCLVTALREIYQIISILIDDPHLTQGQELTYPTETLRQNTSLKHNQPWVIEDEFEPVAVIIAKSMDDAIKVTGKTGKFRGSDIDHASFFEHTILSPLTLWYVTVELDIAPCQPIIHEYKVIAGSKDRAIEIIENHFKENIPLFPVLSITAGKEELIQLGIIDVRTINPTDQP